MNELLVDETLAESFPASDPPAWTLGQESAQGDTQDEERVEELATSPPLDGTFDDRPALDLPRP